MIKLLTPKFRVSFPNVFEPKAIEDGQKKKYSLTMLFNIAEINADPKQKALWDALKKSLAECAREKWGDKIPKALKSPFRDGKEKEQFDGYGDGIIFASASTSTRPGIVDAKMTRIIAPEDFYAGCYAQATVNPYAWSYMGKSGVSFGLQNIQKIADGETFGGRSKPEDDFDAFADLSEAQSTDNETELFMQ